MFSLSITSTIGDTPESALKNLCRVNKENRAAGVLENYEEGKKYAEHSLRQFVRNKSPEIMPSLNKFFADPK